jgi:hypothetical protein
MDSRNIFKSTKFFNQAIENIISSYEEEYPEPDDGYEQNSTISYFDKESDKFIFENKFTAIGSIIFKYHVLMFAIQLTNWADFLEGISQINHLPPKQCKVPLRYNNKYNKIEIEEMEKIICEIFQ